MAASSARWDRTVAGSNGRAVRIHDSKRNVPPRVGLCRYGEIGGQGGERSREIGKKRYLYKLLGGDKGQC